jgi:hypothetical protein
MLPALAHNDAMFRPPPFFLFAFFLLLFQFSDPSSVSARSKPVPALEPGYVPALAAANHLLQAWQSADAESGMVLLTTHAKQSASTDGVERFFPDSGPSAYEISRGKLIKPGRYEFPVVLVLGGSKAQPRRRFSTIVVVNTGHNDCAIDKLP